MIQTFQLDLCPKGLKQRLEQIVAHQYCLMDTDFSLARRKEFWRWMAVTVAQL